MEAQIQCLDDQPKLGWNNRIISDFVCVQISWQKIAAAEKCFFSCFVFLPPLMKEEKGSRAAGVHSLLLAAKRKK